MEVISISAICQHGKWKHLLVSCIYFIVLVSSRVKAYIRYFVDTHKRMCLLMIKQESLILKLEEDSLAHHGELLIIHALPFLVSLVNVRDVISIHREGIFFVLEVTRECFILKREIDIDFFTRQFEEIIDPLF